MFPKTESRLHTVFDFVSYNWIDTKSSFVPDSCNKIETERDLVSVETNIFLANGKIKKIYNNVSKKGLNI